MKEPNPYPTAHRIFTLFKIDRLLPFEPSLLDTVHGLRQESETIILKGGAKERLAMGLCSIGPKRAQRLSAMADAFRAGVKPSMHNDPPVTHVDLLLK